MNRTITRGEFEIRFHGTSVECVVAGVLYRCENVGICGAILRGPFRLEFEEDVCIELDFGRGRTVEMLASPVLVPAPDQAEEIQTLKAEIAWLKEQVNNLIKAQGRMEDTCSGLEDRINDVESFCQ